MIKKLKYLVDKKHAKLSEITLLMVDILIDFDKQLKKKPKTITKVIEKPKKKGLFK